EQFFFLRAQESVKRERIFADMSMDMERDFAASSRQIGKRWNGDGDLVSNTIDVHHGLVRPLGEDPSAQVSNHPNLILAANGRTAYAEIVTCRLLCSTRRSCN